jgi:putative tryptophan/tyrosine transport system substrate-binding protein
MRRREFIAGLGGAAAAWPLVAGAEQPTLIGFLHPGADNPWTRRISLAAAHRGLAETGYVEGRNLKVEYLWADDRVERLPALAAELVRRRVAAILVTTTSAALAAKAATNAIPIVFETGSDPVEIGLVASLNRPSGNLTGVAQLTTAVSAKRLELLHEIVPAATSLACLVNLSNPVFSDAETKELQAAARPLDLNLLILNVGNEGELEPAFKVLVRQGASGIVVGGDAIFVRLSDRLAALAAYTRVPAIYAFSASTVAGGLVSYGTDFEDAARQAGVYVGRILNGEKPADLPVQQVTKLRLVINMKTAKVLGLTFPTSLLVRADEVIE